VKYNDFFYLFIPFFINSPAGQTRRLIFTLMAQTTRTRARVCLLVVSLTLLSIWGVKFPENLNFHGVNKRFQAKRAKQNIESFTLSKLLHQFQPNFAQR